MQNLSTQLQILRKLYQYQVFSLFFESTELTWIQLFAPPALRVVVYSSKRVLETNYIGEQFRPNDNYECLIREEFQ